MSSITHIGKLFSFKEKTFSLTIKEDKDKYIFFTSRDPYIHKNSKSYKFHLQEYMKYNQNSMFLFIETIVDIYGQEHIGMFSLEHQRKVFFLREAFNTSFEEIK